MAPLPQADEVGRSGFLIPPWYTSKIPGKDLLNVASIIWGITISCAGFTAFKAANQSRHSWMKHRLFNSYIILVWITWITSLGLSIISWLYLYEIIPPSFWTFFGILIPWFIQLQCILQIVANRVGFLLHKRKHAKQIKLGVFIIITFITVTVSCTWMPARLQISPLVIRINNVWDRLTKVIFGALDICLNILFLRLVWRHLISNGLTKYWPLFYFNSCAIFVSISLDAIFIGLMSLKSPVVYTQFNPVVFLFKLHIELNLAEMIAEIVQSANQLNRLPLGASGARPGMRSGSRSSSGSSGPDFTLATIITADREPDRPRSSSCRSDTLPSVSPSFRRQQDSRNPKHFPRFRNFCRELMWGYKQTKHRGPAPLSSGGGTGADEDDADNDDNNHDDGIFPRGPLAEELRRYDSSNKAGGSGVNPAAVTEVELEGISRSASYSYSNNNGSRDWGARPSAPQAPRRALTTGRIRIESAARGGGLIGGANAAAAAVHSDRIYDSILMGGVASCCSGQSSTAMATMTMMEEGRDMEEYFPPGLVAGEEDIIGSMKEEVNDEKSGPGSSRSVMSEEGRRRE